MNLQQAMSSLDESQLAALRFARDLGLSHIVKLGNDRYIGVHADQTPYLEPIEKKGIWSYGHIRSQNR